MLGGTLEYWISLIVRRYGYSEVWLQKKKGFLAGLKDLTSLVLNEFKGFD